MKKTDLAMIIFIASIGVIVAYFIAANISFLEIPQDGVKVQVIQTISKDVPQPDDQVFTKDAINPTVEVIVGSEAEATN